jgi:hypothetical protein
VSLDVLADLRLAGQAPERVAVTTDARTAEAWAHNAGFWPVLVQFDREYDFSPLEGLPVVLALPQLKGRPAQQLAVALMQAGPQSLTAYDLELDQTSVVIEA